MGAEFAVIAAKQNVASMNIVSFLEGRLPNNMNLHFFDGHICFIDEADSVDEDTIIFASSHKSESGKPTFTTHCIGNWGKAELGGKDRTLVPTNSFLLKNYLVALQKKTEELNLPYVISAEVTHHGPSLTKPTAFIELGSGEKQWKDKAAAKAVADTIISNTSTEGNYKSAIAIGGGHYCPEFTKVILRTDYALGHICPGYALAHFDKEMLDEALQATLPKPEAIILDWKGLGKEKARIKELLEGHELPILRARKLLH